MRIPVAIALTSIALCGCAGLAVHAPTTARPQSKLAQAQATHEYSSSAPRQQADATALTPIHAIDAFATAYINWNATTVTPDMRALAAASIGQARAAMELAAAGTAQDYELHRGGITNSGTVEAVARLVGGQNQFVVVTRELTSATNTSAYQGLQPAWHLTVATVTQVEPGAWVVSGWQPES